jgi:hypothetical protein
VPRKVKYLDKHYLQLINHLSQNVLKYNRTIREDVIDSLPSDKFFPITFTMMHEHRAGVACEPHVRCMIAIPYNGGVEQVILDMEAGLYDLLPEAELPDRQPEEATV